MENEGMDVGKRGDEVSNPLSVLYLGDLGTCRQPPDLFSR